MAELELTQAEADALIGVDKVKADDVAYTYPGPGELLMIPLISKDRREEFVVDVRRGRIDLAKVTHQLRARKAIVLLRLDLEGPPHRNPDGEIIHCPHLHVYREGFADKWAVVPPGDTFVDLNDRWQTLHDFFRFSHVVNAPSIEKGLFT